ncbi:MAG: glucose-1-phosphate adenylyltransferase subunit GlgD [Oscillospiraceae bacterium]
MKRMMGLIATNYSDGLYGPLTQERPVASLPFGGRYRLVDFPLSNMVNSGILTVGLITPYMYRSLMDHVGVGKEWALSRKIGGMFILPGSIYGLKSVHGKFLLRDIIQNKAYLERGKRDLVVVSGCNKIFNIDFRAVAEQHEASGADITLVYKNSFHPDETHEMYLDISESGRVTEIRNASAEGDGNCFLDAFIINLELLLNFISWYEALGYMDLMEIFEENLDKVKIYSYKFDGYVGAINGLKSYMRTSRELLNEEVRQHLFLPDRPISTKVQDSAPAKYLCSAKVSNSLVSTGCIIEGTVENSILSRGVVVKKGAIVRNSVILQKSAIGAGAVLENVVCDKYVTVKDGVTLLGSTEKPIAIGKKQEM